MADLTTGTNQGICSVRKLGSQWVQPRTLSYNPAERSVLVTTVSSLCLDKSRADGQAQENGQYELVPLPKATGPTASDGKDVPSDGKKGSGYSAIFVARNRLAVLDKVGQVGLCLRTLVDKADG
jgi:coatomer protein complex subunit alpha (xenin)